MCDAIAERRDKGTVVPMSGIVPLNTRLRAHDKLPQTPDHCPESALIFAAMSRPRSLMFRLMAAAAAPRSSWLPSLPRRSIRRPRSGPGTETDEVAVVPAGNTIQIFEIVADGTW